MAQYQVGSAYVPVRPDFRRFHKDIEKEFEKAAPRLAGLGEKWGTELGKGFETGLGKSDPFGPLKEEQKEREKRAPKEGAKEAGAFAKAFQKRLQAAMRSLPKIEIDADSSDTQKEIARVRAELDQLSQKSIGIDIDADSALAELATLETALNTVADGADIDVRADTKLALAEIAKVHAAVQALGDGVEVKVDVDKSGFDAVGGAFAQALRSRVVAAMQSLPKLEIRPDSTRAQVEIQQLRVALEALSNQTVGIDIDAGSATAQIRAIETQLRALSRGANVDVRADTAAAAAALAGVDSQVNALDGRTARIDLDVGRSLRGIGMVTVAAAGLAAIPVGAVLGGSILSLLGPLAAVGAGFGGLATVAIPSVTRISEVLKLQEQAQFQVGGATKSVGQSQAQAAMNAMQLASATENVARAQRDAARAHADALEQVRQQELDLADAQRDARSAQQELNEARRQAVRDAQDLALRLVDATLSVRDAELQLEDARLGVAEQAARTAAAEQAVAAARRSLAESQTELARVSADPAASEEQRKAARDAVAAAKSSVTVAEEQAKQQELAQKRAQLALDRAVNSLKEQRLQLSRLRSEKEQSDRAGIDGDRNVMRARQRLGDANRRLTEQERALARARADVARVDADSALRIADAQRQLRMTRLQQAAAAAAEADAANKVTGSQLKLAAAMAALSPAARQLMRDWLDFKKVFDSWQRDLEPDVLPVLSRGLDLVAKALPTLTPLIRASAGAFDDLLAAATRGVEGPGWKRFIADITGILPIAIVGLGRSVGNVGRGIGGIIQAFLPFAPGMIAGIEGLTARFADWGQELGKTQGFRDFMAWVQTHGPKVWEVLGDIGSAVVNLVKSLAPIGVVALGGIGLLARLIASLEPDIIQAVVVGVVSLTLAIKALNLALFVSPVGLIVLALAGLAAGLYLAYQRFTPFREAVDASVRALTVLADVFRHYVWPVLQQLILPKLRELVAVFGWASTRVQDFANFIAFVGNGLLAFGGKSKTAMVGFQAGVQVGMAGAKLATDRMRGSVRTLSDEIRAMQGLLSKREAFLTYQSSLETSRQALERARTATTGKKQADREAQQAVLAQVRAGVSYIDSLSKQRGGNIKAREEIIRQREQIRKQAGDTGYGKEIIRQYNKMLNAMPGRKKTDIWVDATGRFTAPNIGKGLSFTVPGKGPKTGMGGIPLFEAEGGPISGPGTTTSDSIPAMLSDDEFVIRASAHRKYGTPMLRAINEGRYAHGGPVHLAKGGSVAPGGTWRSDMRGGAGHHAKTERGYDEIVARTTLAVSASMAYQWKDIARRLMAGSGSGIVRNAAKWLGTPYSWGGGGKGGPSRGIQQGAGTVGFDCSGLTEYAAWHGARKDIGGTTYTQINKGRGVGSRANLLPGDLIFPHEGHVMIAASPGAYGAKGTIEAPRTGLRVRWAGYRGMEVGRRVAGYARGGAVRDYARGSLGELGWSSAQWGPLRRLWGPSGWDPRRPGGIPGAFPPSKMSAAGRSWATAPDLQVRWGLGDIASRYGNPAGAARQYERAGFYDQGGMLQPGLTHVINATRRPEAVLSPQQTAALQRLAGGQSAPREGHTINVYGTRADDPGRRVVTALRDHEVMHPD